MNEKLPSTATNILGFTGLLALVLVALNLRPVMAVVSPLLAQVQADTLLNDTMAGLLTTLPVFAMGVFALLGAYVLRFISEKRGIFIGVFIIALACFSRVWFDSGKALIITAAIAGVGIALVQVLIPAFIKTYAVAKAGSLMGFYTTGIMSGAAISAALAAPAAALFGWQNVFIWIGLPALIGAMLWVKYTAELPVVVKTQTITLPLRSARAWLLMSFFGLGTAAFTLVLAWFSPYFMQQGLSAAQSGLLLGSVTLCEVLSGFAVSAFIHRFPDRRPILGVVLGLLLLGLILIVVAPLSLTPLVVVCIGIGIGALFPLSLIVALDHAKSAEEAGALLGFVQGGGYIIASFAPLFAGMIRQHSTELTAAWLLMAVGVLVMLGLTLRLKPASQL